jgi:hypothetical protein
LLIALAVAGAALAAVLVLTLRGGGGGNVVPGEPVEASTQLSKSGTLFADPLRATVQAVVDRNRVDPSRVGFTAHFGPFVQIGAPRVVRHDAKRLTTLRYSVNLICLTNICLSKGKPAPLLVQFPPAEVFYTPRSGGRRALRLPWIATTVGPRTTERDLNGADPYLQPRWRANADPLPVSYAMSPRTLRVVFFAAAGVLLALGIWALLRFVVTSKLRLRPLTPLERAVLLVERAAPESPEKRKALELLSRELGRSGEPELALVAKELAWAEPTPLPTVTQPLTLDVRRVIDGRSNGHGD